MILYYEIRKQILSVCSNIEIIHIGSTAIPGLQTKGDLDINVRVQKIDFWDVINIIKNTGYYELDGTLQNDDLRHLKPIKTFNIDTAIQVTTIGSEYDTFVLFNEILLANKNALKDYSNIKKLYGVVSDDEYRNKKSVIIQYYINAIKEIAQQGDAPEPIS